VTGAELPVTRIDRVGLSEETFHAVRDAVERAGVEAMPAGGPITVDDSRLEGTVILGIWSGGRIPNGVFALSFLASPEINVAGLAPFLRQLADLWEAS
jgi:hypothetical protein